MCVASTLFADINWYVSMSLISHKPRGLRSKTLCLGGVTSWLVGGVPLRLQEVRSDVTELDPGMFLMAVGADGMPMTKNPAAISPTPHRPTSGI